MTGLASPVAVCAASGASREEVFDEHRDKR